MKKLYCDLETYCEIPLKNGTHAYAEQVEIMIWTYALDDGPVGCWDLTTGAPMPPDLKEALEDPDVLTLWQNGGMFDRVVIKHAMPHVYKLLPIERWFDTMVQAFAHGLPGALDKLCEILKVDAGDSKLKEGKQLVQLFCKPRPKNSTIRRATRETHPEEWARFKQYAMNDISAMRAVHKKLPVWNYSGAEMELWRLDQLINMRGVCVDVALAEAAVRAVEREQKVLAKRTQEMTDGYVQSATKRDRLLAYLLAEYGVDLPDMQKSTLERRIDDPELPWALRELLSIRLQASTTSTSKYKTLIKGVSSDGRLRGTLQFDGAQRTGRWAGRLFQPQNLTRLDRDAVADWYDIPVKDVKEHHVEKYLAAGVEALKSDSEDILFGNVMALASNEIRGCIIAPRGKKLVVSDLSNIEGRMLAWLAGEKWKLKAFADFDKGIGHDMYKLAYAKSFGVQPETVDKDQRQKGKVQELALGYEGGVGAFLTFSLTYNIDLEAMTADAYDKLPADLKEEAEAFYAWTVKKRRSTFGLSREVFVTCDTFKRAWRRAHPQTSTFWKDAESAVVSATLNPGMIFECRKVKVRRDGSWLRVRLPSGRFVCYPSPQVDDGGKFSYMGVNQYTRKWSRIKSYGGKLVENWTQAASRDVIGANMPQIEAASYQIGLTVHDEVITEAPDSDEFNSEHLSSLLAANPPWATGLPLAAGGFEAYRYKKD
jgi:DNA polymerase